VQESKIFVSWRCHIYAHVQNLASLVARGPRTYLSDSMTHLELIPRDRTITALNPADPIHQQLRPIITVNECITFGSGFGSESPLSVMERLLTGPSFVAPYSVSDYCKVAQIPNINDLTIL